MTRKDYVLISGALREVRDAFARAGDADLCSAVDDVAKELGWRSAGRQWSV